MQPPRSRPSTCIERPWSRPPRHRDRAFGRRGLRVRLRVPEQPPLAARPGCCRWTSEPPLRVGSTYNQHARFLGRDMVNAFRVVELAPGRRVTFTSESGTFPLTITRTVEPLGAERSRFAEHARGEPGGFFRIAEPLLRPLVKATIKRDFPRLKALLEAPHSVAPRSRCASRCTARTSRSRRAACCARSPRAEAGRLRRRHVVRPLRAVERAPGRVRLRVVVPGRGAGADAAAVRRRQRAGTALPPGDHRPGRGDAVRDVPRAAVDRARHGRGVQRAHHRRRAGRPRPSAPRACASAWTSCARCSPARRSRTAGTWSSTARACGRCPTTPPPLLCAAVSEATARWGGEWADGLATVNAPVEHAAADDRRLRRRRRGRLVLQVHVSWAPTEEEALRIAHDQWRTNVFDPPVLLGPRHARGTSTRRAQFVRPEDVRGKVLVSADLGAARRVAAASSPRSASTTSRCTTSARTSTRSSTPSASTCCPSCA